MSKILIDEATVKLALEALEPRPGMPNPEYESLTQCAITALKALATLPSQQEPVACVQDLDEVKRKHLVYEKGMDWKDPLYTTPQPAQRTWIQPNIDLPDLIAGALGVSRGTAYDMMREALEKQSRQERWQKIECPICGDMAIATDIPPAQRKPLTDDEIYMHCPSWLSQEQCKTWVRQIEVAHGIKENT